MATNVQVILGSTRSSASYETRYSPLTGTSTSMTTYATAAGVVAAAGTLRNLKLRLTAAPGSGKSYTITLFKNGSSTSLAVTVSGSDTYASYSGTVEIAQGDTLAIQIVPSGSPASTTIMSWASEFLSTNNDTLLLTNGSTSQNSHIFPYGSRVATTESYAQVLIPCAGTIKNLFIDSNVAPGGTTTAIFTVRKNGADQSLAVTLTGSSQTTGNNTANSFTVSAGDKVSIQRTGTSTTTMSPKIGLVFSPDTLGNFILPLNGGSSIMNTSNAIYFPLTGPLGYQAIQGSSAQIAPSFTIKNFYAELSGNPSSAQVFTLRVNGSASSLTLTVPTSGNTANASTNVSISSDDVLETHRTNVSAGVGYMLSYTGYKVDIVTNQSTINSGSVVKKVGVQGTINSDSKVITAREQETINSDSTILSRVQETIQSSSAIKATLQQTISSESKIAQRIQEDIDSGSTIKRIEQSSLNSQSYTKRVGEQATLSSDSKVVIRNQATINSDSAVRRTEDSELLSNSKVVIRTQATIPSDSSVRGVAVFYGGLNLTSSNTKDFFGQLTVAYQAPIEVTGLTATDPQYGDIVVLSWNAADNYAYNIYRDVGGTWTKMNDVPVQQESYSAGGLVAGVTYTFKVTAVNREGTETTGVQITKAPSFNSSVYTTAAYQVYISGALDTEVILDSIEQVFGPDLSNATFHYFKRPDQVALSADGQTVQIYIRGTLVFSGYVTRRTENWTSSGLTVEFYAVSKLLDFYRQTCGTDYNLQKGQKPKEMSNSQILRDLGFSVDNLTKGYFYSQVDISNYNKVQAAAYLASIRGNYKVYCGTDGNVLFYDVAGTGTFSRTYTIGQNILSYTKTHDITPKVKSIKIQSAPKEVTVTEYRAYNGKLRSGIGARDTIFEAPELVNFPVHFTKFDADELVENLKDNGSGIYFGEDGVCMLAMGYGVTGKRKLKNISVQANVNQAPQVYSYLQHSKSEVGKVKQQPTKMPGTNEVTDDGDNLGNVEVTPDKVRSWNESTGQFEGDVEAWPDGTVESKNAVAQYAEYSHEWKDVGATVTISEDGSDASIVLTSIPVKHTTNVVQKTLTFVETLSGGNTGIQVPVTILFDPDQWLPELRLIVTYEESPLTLTTSGINPTGEDITQTVSTVPFQRSLPDGYAEDGYVTDNISEVYSEMVQEKNKIISERNDQVDSGTMTILGDETLDLRTKVNGQQVVRIRHDFSNGFITTIDLGKPQKNYGQSKKTENSNYELKRTKHRANRIEYSADTGERVARKADGVGIVYNLFAGNSKKIQKSFGVWSD